MNTIKLIPILIALVLSVFSFTACEKNDQITNVEEVNLSTDEKALLQYMWEEEKLARDVYSHLAGLHDLNVFPNIAGSEQTHMDLIQDIMVQYNLPNSGNNEVSLFTNPTLQEFYNALIAQGETSLILALKVGATIEDVDIFDLRDAKSKTENPDLIRVFDQLECGSRNHMRAFSKKLSEHYVTYVPQFISPSTYDEILAGNHERCG